MWWCSTKLIIASNECLLTLVPSGNRLELWVLLIWYPCQLQNAHHLRWSYWHPIMETWLDYLLHLMMPMKASLLTWRHTWILQLLFLHLKLQYHIGGNRWLLLYCARRSYCCDKWLLLFRGLHFNCVIVLNNWTHRWKFVILLHEK